MLPESKRVYEKGKILAHAAMEEGFEVAWIPSYGPEMCLKEYRAYI